MADQLSYVLVTPYSIRKSRTGGILSRLLARSGLELVGSRMFIPSPQLVEEYTSTIVTETDARHRRTQELIQEYVRKNFVADAAGNSRVLMLILRGPDAVAKVLEVAGHIVHERTTGETIRDTYGDYLVDANEAPVYFEPAVLVPPTEEAARRGLQIWAKYSDSDGNIPELAPEARATGVERTLVLIKPDNFRFPNMRPGGVIDTFSRAGLPIVAFKIHHMSVAQAEEFYGPVLDALKGFFRESTGKRSRLAIEEELGVPLTEEMETKLGEMVGPVHARYYWESIVQFMSGARPSDCTVEQKDEPGSEKCVALVYEGVDAVAKIRKILGPTDPSKAPHGSIRKEFGQTIMINAAHASDSPENAAREMKIIRITENNLKPLIESNITTS